MACDRAGVWGTGWAQGHGARTRAAAWGGRHVAGVWDTWWGCGTWALAHVGPGAGDVGRGTSWSPTTSRSRYVPRPLAESTLGTGDTPELSQDCPYCRCCPLPTDAPWCGHCQRLAPAFAQAAATLRNESSLARLGKVDATAQAALANEFGITSYPTLKLFHDGNRTHPLAYTGRAVVRRDGHGSRRGRCHDGCWGTRTGGRG